MAEPKSGGVTHNQWIAAGVATLLVVGALMLLLRNDSSKEVVTTTTLESSTTASSSSTATTKKPVTTTKREEFGTVRFSITSSDGKTFDGCALLAAARAQLSKGMMGRQSFGQYDAMVFRFEQDSCSKFYMKNVLIPLSVAWYRADGTFVSSRDMELCPPEKMNDCPLYEAEDGYRFAIETPFGGLDELGIGPGSSMSLGGGCTPTP